MVEFLGILKVKVIKGTNLAVRDMLSSDPYVVLTLGQKVSLSRYLVHLFHYHQCLQTDRRIYNVDYTL